MDKLLRIVLPIAAMYMRHTPINSGRWRLNQLFLPVLRRYGSELGERVIRTRYGFKMQADLGDWLGQKVYLTGAYERQTASLIATLLRPGDVAVDIGANAGFFTLLAARRVGGGGRVHAFEPVPLLCERIVKNLVLNQLHNVELHAIALSNVSGVATFHEGPESHKGISSLRPIRKSSAHYVVRTAPFDEILGASEGIRLIKIDVEGAEGLVLEGMRGFLRRNKPHLVVEMTDDYLRAFGHTGESLKSGLLAQGYHMYRIADEGPGTYQNSRQLQPSQFNALFTTMQRLPSEVRFLGGTDPSNGAGDQDG